MGHGKLITLHTKSGEEFEALAYPPLKGAPLAFVVLAPGSGGGLGPVLGPRSPQPLRCRGTDSGRGAYWVSIATVLSTGTMDDWKQSRSVVDGKTETLHPGAEQLKGRVACIQFTWPGSTLQEQNLAPRLLQLRTLQIAVEQVSASLQYLRSKYTQEHTRIPILLGGFSFGGPTAIAAARQLSAAGERVVGVMTLAGSGRGGSHFEQEGLDTLGAVHDLSERGIPQLFIAGTHDSLVPEEVVRWIRSASGNGSGAASLAVLRGDGHQLHRARQELLPLLYSWCVNVLSGDCSGLAAPGARNEVLLGTAASYAARLRGCVYRESARRGSDSTPQDACIGDNGEILPPPVGMKGYSELPDRGPAERSGWLRRRISGMSASADYELAEAERCDDDYDDDDPGGENDDDDVHSAASSGLSGPCCQKENL